MGTGHWSDMRALVRIKAAAKPSWPRFTLSPCHLVTLSFLLGLAYPSEAGAHVVPRQVHDRIITVTLTREAVEVEYVLEVDEWTIVKDDLPDDLRDVLTRVIRTSSSEAAQAMLGRVGCEYLADILPRRYGLYDPALALMSALHAVRVDPDAQRFVPAVPYIGSDVLDLYGIGRHLANRLLRDGERVVDVISEHLTFWPFTHGELAAGLRTAGLEPVSSTYALEVERYRVVARRPHPRTAVER